MVTVSVLGSPTDMTFRLLILQRRQPAISFYCHHFNIVRTSELPKIRPIESFAWQAVAVKALVRSSSLPILLSASNATASYLGLTYPTKRIHITMGKVLL